MMAGMGWIVAFGLGLLVQDPPKTEPPKSVASILEVHDRALIRALDEYARANPKAIDVDQAYITLFDKALDHDWFAEAEPIARRYLAERPEGPSRPVAQLIGLLARARDGQFAEALAGYQGLLAGLDRDDQDEFASQVADSLVKLAIEAADHETARKTLDALIARFPKSEAVRQKAPLARDRLNLIGQSAPAAALASDIQGKPLRLTDYRGKYVLVDFWASFCAPWVGDLARLQAVHAKYQPRGLEIIGVSLDDTREEVVDFVKARKVPWRQIHAATSGDDLVAAFKVGALPASFLIDPQGKITRLDLRGDTLETAIAPLLDAARTTAKPAPAPARR